VYTRRNVIKAASLGGIAYLLQTIGCRSREAVNGDAEKSVTASPRTTEKRNVLTFEELTAFVRSRYGKSVREVKKLGQITVVFLGDVHVAKIAKSNKQRLSELEEVFDIQIVGTEGTVEHPESQVDEEVHEYVKRVFSVKPELVIELGGARGATVIEYPAQGSYEDLYSDDRFKAIGLESKEMAPLVGLGAHAEQIIDMLMDVVTRGYMPVRRGDRTEGHILQYLQIQEALKEEELFPRLDLSRITSNKDGIIVLGKEDNRLIGELAVKFSKWRDIRMNAPRNAIAVPKLIDAMESQELKRGAMIFGRGHSEKAQFNPDGLTMQERLAERNVSYIVIDP